MDNEQRAILDALKRIQQFNSTNSVALATIPDYAGEQTIFDSAVAKIIAAGNVQAEDLTGYADASDQKLDEMAKSVLKFARRGKVKAKRANNLTLLAQLNHTKTYFVRTTKTNSLQRATDTRKALNDNLAVCTNVSPADILEIDGKIAAYSSASVQPVAQHQDQKALGTDVIIGQIKIALDAEQNMYDYVVSYFEDTVNSPLIDEFALAGHQINTGIRHNVVDFLIEKTEDNSPLNAHIVDNSNGKEYDTVDGALHIATHQSGKFHFTISAAGRTTVDFVATIKKGTHNSFTVKLASV